MHNAFRRLLGPVALLLLLAGVGGGTYLLQQRLNASPPAPVAVAPTPPPPPPIAQVTNAVRELKLVTWRFDTTLDARVVSDKWYGDATARVQAPVRYQYGVDLGTLTSDNAFFDSAGARYVFLVAPPRRLSVEVDVKRLEQSLSVSGLRWRSRNADAIDAARQTLAARADALVLEPADQQRLLDVSRTQLEGHLADVIGRVAPAARVVVRFAD